MKTEKETIDEIQQWMSLHSNHRIIARRIYDLQSQLEERDLETEQLPELEKYVEYFRKTQNKEDEAEIIDIINQSTRLHTRQKIRLENYINELQSKLEKNKTTLINARAENAKLLFQNKLLKAKINKQTR